MAVDEHSWDFTLAPPLFAAALIGAFLTVDGAGGRIVETEAYDADDPASHSYAGPSPRNGIMFGPPGRAYVYRSYGLHWCLNIVCGAEAGGAVLIRAIEPIFDLPALALRRGTDDPAAMCSGPGKLCQALGVTSAHNGLSVSKPPFQLWAPDASAFDILTGPRIGISRGVATPWRFGLAGSRFLSRRFP